MIPLEQTYVYVPVPPADHTDGAALKALAMEGFNPIQWRCFGELNYGAMFALTWDLGHPFIVVEHDIVPWPGALRGLLECPEPWCTHAYPLGVGNVTTSFGIGKYTPKGPAPAEWRETPWRLLDGEVIPHLIYLYGESHVHTPPVAHARAELP